MPEIETSTDPLAPAEAIAYFKAKVPAADWETIESAENEIAFKVAGIADLDVLDDVYAALEKALAEGASFEDFKADVGARLEDAWGGDEKNPGWRLENIFRTNLQSAYQAGHYQQAQEQKDDRPYGMLDVIEDSSTSEICSDLDAEIGGQAIPLDDPIWDTAYPPNHYECRSTVITLTEDEAREMGILDDPPDVEVAEGFDHPPGFVPDEDPEEYAPDLAEDVARFTDGGEEES